MNRIGCSVAKTLAYSDCFNFPLTKKEIYSRFISPKPVSPGMVNVEIDRMLFNGHLKKTGSYLHFPGRGSIVAARLQRRAISQQKLHQATQFAQKIINLPFVDAVFLTGAIAVNNATHDDDIDLLVVTRLNSLWTARFLTTIALELSGSRRRPQSLRVADKVCANMYLSADFLAVPFSRRNLYTAFEVIQAVPLADPHQIYPRFLFQNSWVKEFLPHAKIPSTETDDAVLRLAPQAPPWLEAKLFNLQQWYMSGRKTRELVTRTRAFFHPRDLAADILDKYHAKVESYTHELNRHQS